MPRPKTPKATSWSVRSALAAVSSSTISPTDASSPPARCVSPLMGSLNLFFVFLDPFVSRHTARPFLTPIGAQGALLETGSKSLPLYG